MSRVLAQGKDKTARSEVTALFGSRGGVPKGRPALEPGGDGKGVFLIRVGRVPMTVALHSGGLPRAQGQPDGQRKRKEKKEPSRLAVPHVGHAGMTSQKDGSGRGTGDWQREPSVLGHNVTRHMAHATAGFERTAGSCVRHLALRCAWLVSEQ